MNLIEKLEQAAIDGLDDYYEFRNAVHKGTGGEELKKRKELANMGTRNLSTYWRARATLANEQTNMLILRRLELSSGGVVSETRPALEAVNPRTSAEKPKRLGRA